MGIVDSGDELGRTSEGCREGYLTGDKGKGFGHLVWA